MTHGSASNESLDNSAISPGSLNIIDSEILFHNIDRC